MRLTCLPLAAGFFLSVGSLAAQDSLATARNALAESLPDVAATRIERYLSAKSDLDAGQKAEAHLLLGEAHLRAGDTAKALNALEKVPETHLSRRNYWEGLALAQQHDLKMALEKLSQVSPEHAIYPQALFNQMELHFSQQNWAKSFHALKKLREHSPDFQSRGLALLETQLYLAIDEPANALKALGKAEGPGAAASILRGRIALRENNLAAALDAFESARQEAKTPNLKTLSLLGKSDTLLQEKNLADAIEPLLEILRETTTEPPLALLHPRFELLLDRVTEKAPVIAALTGFVSPATLGEDSNYTTASKLFALYYLSRFSDVTEATKFLNQILTLEPESPLAARAHFQLAKLALDEEQPEASEKHLEAILETTPGSTLASKSSDLLARLAVAEGNFSEAEKLFAQAATHPDTSFTEQALLNQALLKLSADPGAPLSALANQLDTYEAKSSLELERALAFAREKTTAAREALEQFLMKHPSHSRMGEARLALADILLSEPQPDFKLIEAQLISLPDAQSRELSHDGFRVAHRLGTITNDWTNAVTLGEKHRKNFPEAEGDAYFLLRLAESCFQNGDYNRSRFLFSEIAALPEAGELVELAQLYAARSNLLIPTPEATTEALDILDGIIGRAGPLTTRARLMKARTLLKSQGQAKDCLRTLEGIPGKPGDQPEAALLSAQAYRELASNDAKAAPKAISIYQRLLDDPRTSYPLSNEIHYQLALTHRENGNLNLAIDPCLRVVDFENKPKTVKEVEWDYYYRCGFEAIDILLEAKRTRAALILARKLAQTNGPGAVQAKERAEQIQLDHQLWTD